jgi:hypothetical protein
MGITVNKRWLIFLFKLFTCLLTQFSSYIHHISLTWHSVSSVAFIWPQGHAAMTENNSCQIVPNKIYFWFFQILCSLLHLTFFNDEIFHWHCLLYAGMKCINKILMDLHIFSTPKYEKAVFGLLSVHLYVCMCSLLAPELLDGLQLYSVFRLAIIGL